jgi:inositol-phosphate phosphatase/L-galactose 1-phosphate phosphatase/histidinol-phosphatase
MTDACPADFIALAESLADQSGAVLRRYFRQPLTIDCKADLSPVTAADREVESLVRAGIEAAFPEHGILGEEFGAARSDAEYVWVIDPIDGTKAFMTGKATFGTLIALTRHGTPILGIIDQPILRERWLGAQSRPTTFNGERIAVRSCAQLADATLYATTPQMFVGADAVAFERLMKAVKYPLYGADCYAYGLLASGFTDLVCEASLQPYDYCALVPVVTGAGGRMSDWHGQPLSLASHTASRGRVLASGDAALHDRALELLAG